MSKKTVQGEFIDRLVAEFPNVAALTLAKKAYREAPELFTNVEAARSLVRMATGNCGKAMRRKRSDKSNFRNPRKPGDPFGSIPKPISPWEFEWKAIQYDGPFRCLILSDIHVPYHDLDALQVALRYGVERKANFILLNGDIADCHRISRWETDARARRFPEERDDVIQTLRSIRAGFPKARIVFKEGNHEERYMSYMRLKAPELLGIEAFELKNLFELSEMNIEHVGEKRPIRLGKLNVIHGHEFGKGGASSPVNPARGFFLKAKAHVLGGHFHQKSDHQGRTLEGHVIAAYSTGCLCELHPAYAVLNQAAKPAGRSARTDPAKRSLW